MLTHNNTLLFAVTGFVMCLLTCSNPGGSGEETTNGMVSGIMVNQNGSAAVHTFVSLYPALYDPVKNHDSIPVVETNDSGAYVFSGVHYGNYNIVAVQQDTRTKVIIGDIAILVHRTIIPPAMLALCGTVKVAFPASANMLQGYIYVPGTNNVTFVNGNSNSVILDSVPAGSILSVNYCATNVAASSVVRYNVAVASADTAVVYNPAWKYEKDLILNTTATGANVTGNVLNFPVLIRLTSENFNFLQAKNNGADIRFAKAGNTFLHYEIERWDPTNKQAEIWIKTDTLFGNDSIQYVSMFWGNPDAISESNGAMVFDTSRGFFGVWHLAGSGTDTAFDATGNHINGTPYNLTAASAIEGAIGLSRYFDGSSQYISMENSASGVLNIPENGVYSMSVWAYADTLDSLWHAIAGKGHEQYYMQLKCLGKNRATWEFVEFHNQAGWEYTEDSVSRIPGAGAKTWMNLVGVRSGTSQRLYINGTLVIDTASLMAGAYARNITDNFMIGRYARQVTLPYSQGYSYFKGAIDEVRVCSFAPSEDWIKLCYMNQKSVDALVKF